MRVSGYFAGVFFYFENTGSAEVAAFVARTGAANPLDGQVFGDDSTPALGDLDGDGNLDLVTGATDGTFHVHYFPEPGRGLLLGAGIALLRWLERREGRAD